MKNKNTLINKIIPVKISYQNHQLHIKILFINIKINPQRNYLKHLYSFILRKFPHKKQHEKYYNYIIPLGKNCEFSVNFHKHYNFVDSTLFNWSYIEDNNCLLMALKHPELIFEEKNEYNYQNNMWYCSKYKLYFHGRSLPSEMQTNKQTNIEEDFKELKDRIKYLAEKTARIINSDDKKLFVITLHINDFNKDINDLNLIINYLSEISKNFDFLIIIEKNNLSLLSDSIQQNKNIFIRTVNNFAPYYSIHKGFDPISWLKIFQEFKPLHIKKKTKIYKFELLN